MKKFASLHDAVGEVICEQPYVKLLSIPRYEEYEIVPGMVQGRWEALAQVDSSLAIIELSVRQIGEFTEA